MFKLKFHEDWDKYFHNLSQDVQKRIWKKINQIEKGSKCRHLKYGLPFFVAESGQYRVTFIEDSKNKTREIYFAGKHKDYDKWLRKFK